MAGGTLGKGTTLGISGTQNGTYTVVGKINQMTPPAVTVGASETTTFEDDADAFIPGFVAGGTYEFDLVYDTANTVGLYALIGILQWFHVTLPDGHVWEFNGFIDSYAPAVPLKEKITEKVKVKITGKPTYA